MDFGFTLRVRRPRRRDLLAPRDLPLLFVRLAAEQSASVTALAQIALDRSGDAWTPFAQRVAIFTGRLAADPRPICPSFAAAPTPLCPPSTKMKAPFTLALQYSFKPDDLEPNSSIEQPGAAPPARGPND